MKLCACHSQARIREIRDAEQSFLVKKRPEPLVLVLVLVVVVDLQRHTFLAMQRKAAESAKARVASLVTVAEDGC